MNVKAVLKSSWYFASGFRFQVLFWNLEWILIARRVWRHLNQHLLGPCCFLRKLYASSPRWALRASARPPTLALLALLERNYQSSFLIHELQKQFFLFMNGHLFLLLAKLRYRRLVGWLNISCHSQLIPFLLRWPPTLHGRQLQRPWIISLQSIWLTQVAEQQTHQLGVTWRLRATDSILMLAALLLSQLIPFLSTFMWLYLKIIFTLHVLSLSWVHWLIIKRFAWLHVNGIFRIFFKLLVSLHHFYLGLMLYILRGKMFGLDKAVAGLVWLRAHLLLLALLVSDVVYWLLSQIISSTKGGVHGSLDSKVASSSFVGVFGAWAYYVDDLELIGSKYLFIYTEFAYFLLKNGIDVGILYRSNIIRRSRRWGPLRATQERWLERARSFSCFMSFCFFQNWRLSSCFYRSAYHGPSYKIWIS